MAFRGRKVADVYAELHLDRDTAQNAIRGLPVTMGGDAERAGRELGKKMTDGLAKAVESSSARLVKARRDEQKATDAVKLAEVRLQEAREKGGQKASTLLALEQRLTQAQTRLSDAQDTTTSSTKKLEDAQRRLATSMGDVGKGLGPNAERAGDDAGGKLAMGMRMSIIRNSPLIAAAIGGVLTAGAPLMMTAATGLFAGIGIVSAAQSQRVQQAWLGTWDRIKASATSDARVIEPVLVGMAGRVADAFEDLPLGEAFEAAAPQIGIFTDGIIALAQNAMPGLLRSIQAGRPVTEGFAEFLAKTGTGLSDFFDRITAHGPAAGQVWSQLGDTFAILLPLLGELVGQGAELAADVLPMMNTSLGMVLGVTTALGPALPAVVAGFAGLKIAQAVTGWIDGAGAALERFAARQGLAAASTGKVGTALSAMSAAAGPVAIAIGVITAAHIRGKQAAESYGRAMLEGGKAADQAFRDTAVEGSVDKIASSMGGLGTVVAMFTASTEEAKDAANDLWNAMTPLQKAQTDVTYWTNELSTAMEDGNYTMVDRKGKTVDIATAQGLLSGAQERAARLERDLEKAIRGVTEAMAAQADQARARVDANFAYEHSINGVEDAQKALADAQAHLHDEDEKTRTSMEDVQRAALGLNEAYSAQVAAAQELATSQLPASMNDQQKAIIGAKAALDELNALIAFGVQLPPSMEAYRQQLINITGEADGAKLAQAQMAAAVAELGFAVTSLPDGKSIRIEGGENVPELRDRLRGLGFDVITLPDGKSVEVRALTDEAKGNVGELSGALADLGNLNAVPQVSLNPQPVIDGAAAAGVAVDVLGQKRADPMAHLSDDPLVQAALNDLGLLGNLATQAPLPSANLADEPLVRSALNDLGLLANLNGQTPTPAAGLADAALVGTVATDQAHLDALHAQRPTPLAALNDGSLVGTALSDMGLLGNLNGQHPTPVAALYDSPFQGTAGNVFRVLGDLGAQRPTPAVGVTDWASGPLRNIKSALDAIQSKTVTVTTDYQSHGTPGTAGKLALGGNVGKAIRGFAPGGSPRRRADGRLIGPGGPMDDLIPAITNMGEMIRVANSEWIINGRVSRQQGEPRMALLNAGRADIVPRDVRRFDRGGTADQLSRAAESEARVVIYGGITVKVETPLNLMNDRDLDRAAQVLEQKLVDIGRRRR